MKGIEDEPDRARREVVYEGGGSQLLLSLVPEGSGHGATFDTALQF